MGVLQSRPGGVTGVTRVAATVAEPEIDELARASVLAIDSTPHGVFGVDMTYGRDGKPNLTEINIGRFFTTIHFFATAGLNMPLILRDLALDGVRPEARSSRESAAQRSRVDPRDGCGADAHQRARAKRHRARGRCLVGRPLRRERRSAGRSLQKRLVVADVVGRVVRVRGEHEQHGICAVAELTCPHQRRYVEPEHRRVQ